MNGYEFAISLVDILAWPVVVAGVLIWGRKNINTGVLKLMERIPQIKVLQAWQAKVEFEIDAEEVQRAATTLSAAAQAELSGTGYLSAKVEAVAAEDRITATEEARVIVHPTTDVSNTDSQLAELLDVDPKSAVIAAWIGVESRLRMATDRPDVPWSNPKRVPLRRQAQWLMGDGEVGRGVLEIFDDLQAMRNKLLHGEDVEITRSAARNYLEAANALRAWFTLREIEDSE